MPKEIDYIITLLITSGVKPALEKFISDLMMISL